MIATMTSSLTDAGPSPQSWRVQAPGTTDLAQLPRSTGRPQRANAFRGVLTFFVLSVSSTSCAPAHFTPAQRHAITRSIQLGSSALNHPLFSAVLDSLDRQSAIEWSEARLEPLPVGARARPTHWVFGEFKRRGHFRTDSILPYRSFWPWSKTVAKTTPGTDATWLNVRKLGRHLDTLSYVNTLIHERTHSFRVLHPESQARDRNVCDAGYIFGDLAEAIARHRENRASQTGGSEAPCPALCRELLRAGVATECSDTLTVRD